MELSVMVPQSGTHRAHTLELASSHSRSVSPITQSPYTETDFVQGSHLQAAKSGDPGNPCPPSVSHAPDTSGLDYHGTPCKRTSQETVRQNLPDEFLSESEVPFTMSNVQDQHATESNMHPKTPEATSKERQDEGNLEPVPLQDNCERSHMRTSRGERFLETQLKSYRRSTARHHPFGAASSCCSVSHSSVTPRVAQGATNGIPPITDITRQTRWTSEVEHVVLRINGLECGWCEGGLSRALERINAIRNYNVNTILGRIEFDLDVNRLDVDDAIKLLTIRTGYDLEEHIASDGQLLELIITDPQCLKHAGQPRGVIRVEALERAPRRPLNSFSRHSKTTWLESTSATIGGLTGDDDTAEYSKEDGKHRVSNTRIHPTRIYYDPTKIGARDVFEHYLKHDLNLRLPPPTVDPGIRLGDKQTKRALSWFLPTLALTIPMLVFAWSPIDHARNVYMHASLALATLIQVVAFVEFVPNALRSLYHSHVLEMDFLIAISTSMAYAFSVVSYVLEVHGTQLETGSFFETSTLLVTLILLGRVVSEFARFQAAKSVSFRSLQVEETLLVLPSPNHTWANVKTTRIDSRLLQYGDVFMVPSYTRIATDRIVLYGGSNVDESMLTGEFKPKAKGLSSQVFAGTNNQDGSLIVSLRKLPCENSVSQIATLVENARLGKPRTHALADHIAGWFVFAIAMIGVTVFVSWLLIERLRNHHTWKTAILTAATYAIATLVVSCPCAIGLAVPMVVLIASGVAARHGIILRDPQMLEIACKVTDVVFDKTGTLTSGKMEVVGVPRYYSTDRARIKGLMMGLLKDIKHPVAIGIAHYLAQDRVANKEFNPIEVGNIVSFPGKGVQGTCAKSGVVVRAGNAEWLNIDVLGCKTDTRCYFSIAGVVQASFELKENIRPGGKIVAEKLHARRLRVHIISGDTEGAVDDVANALHIHKDSTKSRCSPDEKRAYIKDLQDQGRIIMFVGDGTNDSVALKQAHIGVHVGEGSDVAKSAADIVLMTTRLHEILILLDISGAAYRRMITNFSWSSLYNVFAILFAAGAFVSVGSQIRIKPQWAGLGELISVLPVVLIAFQMQWRDYGNAYRLIENDYQKAEVARHERVIQGRTSFSTEGAKCTEISKSRLAKIDDETRQS